MKMPIIALSCTYRERKAKHLYKTTFTKRGSFWKKGLLSLKFMNKVKFCHTVQVNISFKDNSGLLKLIYMALSIVAIGYDKTVPS